ncbi:cyclopropane-fatty-acyl-phospholipid synthase family protein [Akkermansiaceae bacterium]|nr:cyclopropane-fatty-acyl-phospholipid synthase family protein [Akkermansiaceae bacterium]MDB4696999.1 cyclopropane-fatty-acyl-phospholipid synthase family protein [Akkermansiaceae bacterium]
MSNSKLPIKYGLPERLVVGLLNKLTKGHLKLTYADGSSRHFGNPAEPVNAAVKINDDAEFFKRCAYYGNVGMGEAYSDGIWNTPDIRAVISWFILNMQALQGADTSSDKLPGVGLLKVVNWFRHLRRANTVGNSRQNISEHYDLGNEFYSLWLDATMTYSCAKFEEPDQEFEKAQTAKYEALCYKLKLKPTDHVLEIGCGWGGFGTYAAKTYGCKVTGVTISEEQAKFARGRVKREGLEDQFEILIQDYRHIKGQFDKIVSIEMIEAVGDRFHQSFFAKCHEVLAPDGILALQMITVPDNRYKSLTKGVDWIQKVIFPGSLLLSVGRVNEVLLKTSDLFLHDLEDFGSFYVHTLGNWHERFNAAKDSLFKLGFDERFMRTWNYYLKYCQAGFATRNISVVQAIYTRPNNPALMT